MASTRTPAPPHPEPAAPGAGGATLPAPPARVPTSTRASHAWIEHGRLVVRLEDGRELATPLEWFPFLGQARPAQRERVVVEAGGYALYWPDLDEALGVPRLFGLTEEAE